MTFRRFKKASKKVIQVNQEKIRNGKAAFSKGFKEVTLCNTCVYIETDTDFEGKSYRFLVL